MGARQFGDELLMVINYDYLHAADLGPR